MTMKKTLVTLALASSLAIPQLNAMVLKGEKETVSPVYKPTKSAVKKAMDKMGIKYSIDKDGDLYYEMDKTGWKIYVVFNTMSNGKLWNLQVMSQFGTKKSRYDELLAYVNKWNTEKKYPKVAMIDHDSMRLTLNFPIQYGFNPDEFEENVIDMFETTIKTIADDTDAMRR